jgi:two-component system cell cycle response regulator
MQVEIKNRAPLILDKIASLMTIRDIGIFEFSFLKTLANMLDVNEISMYKFNNTNEPSRMIKYSSGTEITAGTKIDEVRELYLENIDIPDALNSAIEWIKSTGKVYSTQTDHKFLTIYPITGPNDTTIGYLAVSLLHERSESENLIIKSLLNISENFHSLLEENQKDKLTGLLNRKTFDESIYKIRDLISFSPSTKAYSGAENRKNKGSDQYWLSLIDIDHFKKINDSFGHIYGDEVLLMLSQIMKKTFRPNDLLFRFGGEEFIVVAKTSNKIEAKSIFERFRETMEKFVFPQVGQVTVSMGATEIKGQYMISSDIVGKADQALYHAKSHGRNKLYFFEELLSKGAIEQQVEREGDVELF